MILSIKQVLPQLYNDLESFFSQKTKLSIKSGIELLDAVTGGFFPGELTLFSGADKNCLYGLCHSIAMNVLKTDEVSVFIHSGDHRYSMNRIAGVVTGFPIDNDLSSNERARLSVGLSLYATFEDFMQQGFYLADSLDNWEEEIKKCNELNRPAKEILLIEDINALSIQPNANTSETDETVGRIKFLKDFAQTYRIPVIANIIKNAQTETDINLMAEPHKIISVTDTGEICLHDKKALKKINLNILRNTTAVTGEFALLFDPLSGCVTDIPSQSESFEW